MGKRGFEEISFYAFVTTKKKGLIRTKPSCAVEFLLWWGVHYTAGKLNREKNEEKKGEMEGEDTKTARIAASFFLQIVLCHLSLHSHLVWVAFFLRFLRVNTTRGGGGRGCAGRVNFIQFF